MRFEGYSSREEVFAQYPKLAQWWAQEYTSYGEKEEERIKVRAGGLNR